MGRSLANVQESVDARWDRESGHVGRHAREETRGEKGLIHSSTAHYTACFSCGSCRRSALASCTYIGLAAVFIGSGGTVSSVFPLFSNLMHESNSTLNYFCTHELLALDLQETMLPCETSGPPGTIPLLLKAYPP